MLTTKIKKQIEDIVYLAEDCGRINARIIDAGIANDPTTLEEYIVEGKEIIQELNKNLCTIGIQETADFLADTMNLYIKLSQERIRFWTRYRSMQ